MRRTAVLAATLVVAAACGPAAGDVGHGRRDSWRQVDSPAYAAGPSSSISGLLAPGSGWPLWVAVGGVDDHTMTAVAWSSPDGTRWNRSDLDDGDARASEASAVTQRQGLAVVVGSVTTRDLEQDGRIWATRDGASWSAVTVPAGGPGDQRLTSVASGPLGFVAAGMDGPTPALWWSADGLSWSRVGGGPFADSERVEAVAVGPAGAVAVGTLSTSGDVDGMAWFSADGVNWRTVPLGAAGFTGPSRQAVHSVTATASGFVAVGEDANGERTVAAAWTTADGIAWQRQPANEMTVSSGLGTAGVSARAVAGSGPVVAVGGSSSVQVWSSPDGRRWTREESPPSERGSARGALVATDGRALLVWAGASGLRLRLPGAAWVEVGADRTVFPRASHAAGLHDAVWTGSQYVASGDAAGAATVWQSPDGLTWEKQGDPEGVFRNSQIDALTVWDGHTIAAGAAPGPQGDMTVAALWMSDDGGWGWRRLDPGNLAFSTRPTTQMFGVTGGASGLVATGIGWDNVTIDAHAWYSNDGLLWRRATEPPAWSGPGDQTLDQVCTLPGTGGFLAFGYSLVLGARYDWVWFSSDGSRWEQVPTEAQGAGGHGLRGASCASTPSGVLVAGSVPGRGGNDGLLLKTTDGRTWISVGNADALSTENDDLLSEVAADGDRIVVTAEDEGSIRVHASADGGRTWMKGTTAPLVGTGRRAVWDVVIAGDTVLMTGFDDASGAVWIGPAPSAPAPSQRATGGAKQRKHQ